MLKLSGSLVNTAPRRAGSLSYQRVQLSIHDITLPPYDAIMPLSASHRSECLRLRAMYWIAPCVHPRDRSEISLESCNDNGALQFRKVRSFPLLFLSRLFTSVYCAHDCGKYSRPRGNNRSKSGLQIFSGHSIESWCTLRGKFISHVVL